MEILTVLTIVSGLLVTVVGAVEVLIGLYLGYALQKLRPPEELEARIMRNDALIGALEAQVTKLRTSKAGRISNAKRAQEAPPEPEEEEDPLLAGLSEDDRALFQ